MRRLRTQCEKAKIDLSIIKSVEIVVDALYKGEDFIFNLKRETFDEIIQKDAGNCLNPIEKVLNDTNMNKSQINEVIMTGGSIRIPKIKETIGNYFGDKVKIKTIFNPDEAVAVGATLQTGMILTNQNLHKN